MSQAQFQPTRAALLSVRAREAATFAWICAFVGVPAWLWCWLSYLSLDAEERVGGGTVLAGGIAVIATALFAAAAGASMVLGTLAEAERAG
jgi:hypothetical protein